MHHMTICKTTEYKKEACGIQKRNHMAGRELIYTTCMPSMATSINTARVHQIMSHCKIYVTFKEKKKALPQNISRTFLDVKTPRRVKQTNFCGTGSVTPGSSSPGISYSAFKQQGDENGGSGRARCPADAAGLFNYFKFNFSFNFNFFLRRR